VIFLAVLALLVLTVVSRIAERSWFGPATVLSVYWLVMLSFASAVPEFLPRAGGAWMIVASITAFAVGALPFSAGAAGRVRRERAVFAPPPWAVLAPVAGTLSALGAAALTVRATGLVPVLDRGVDATLAASNEIAVDLFSGGAAVPVMVAPLMSLTYTAAAIAGITHLAAERRWGRRVAVALTLSPIAASGVVALSTTRRFGLLLTSLLTLGSLAAVRMLPRRSFALYRREVLISAVAVASVTVVFIVAAVLRIGQLGPNTSEVLGDKLTIYAIGSVPAFTTWYDAHSREESIPLAVGASTVEGFSLLTPRGSSRGFDARVVVGNDSTNVYTVFRTVIEDVGSAGGIVFWLLLGALLGRMWLAVSRRHVVRALHVVVLSFWWAFVGLGQTQSIFIFTNVAAALVASAVLALMLEARTNVAR
jgi:hypothetical protein